MGYSTPTTHTLQSVFCCDALSAQQGGVTLYESVGFTLMEGAVLVIAAGNGVGKTTLLKQLAGFTRPESGMVRWFDTPILSARHYTNDMLYIGDMNGLYPDLTVKEQLLYFAQTWGEKARMPAAIRYMQLEPYLDVRIATLSAGWKRRVALSRLLIIPALLWLLDEPTVHLDATACTLLGGMIHSHAEQGGITIMTMPQINAAPTIHNTPVSVLRLEDFCDSSIEI